MDEGGFFQSETFSLVMKLPYLFPYPLIRFAELNTNLHTLLSMMVYDSFLNLNTTDISGEKMLCGGARGGEGAVLWAVEYTAASSASLCCRSCSFPAASLTVTTETSPATAKCSLGGKLPLAGDDEKLPFLPKWANGCWESWLSKLSISSPLGH